MRRPYQFAILRYVFSQASQEFVNVGVVSRSLDDGMLHYFLSARSGRLSYFFRDGFSAELFRQVIETTRARFDNVIPQLNRERRPDLFSPVLTSLKSVMSELVRIDGTVLQWSEIMSGVAASVESETHAIFREFVERHEPERKRKAQSEDDVWRVVRDGLEESPYRTDRRIQYPYTIKGEEREWTFKMGWPNGVPQVVDAISFDLVSADSVVEKAETWRGRIDALADSNKFRLTIIVGPPTLGSASVGYSPALSILRHAPCVRHVLTQSEARNALLGFFHADLGEPALA